MTAASNCTGAGGDFLFNRSAQTARPGSCPLVAAGLLNDLRELIKLPHVRQLQESSLGLSRGRPAGGRLGPGNHFLMVYTCFRDFEALRVDSQHHISRPC